MDIIKLLNKEYAELFYDKLLLIYTEDTDTRKKVRTLSKLFNEILDSLLSLEVQSFQSMLAKILFIVDKYNIKTQNAASLRNLYLYFNKIARNKTNVPQAAEIEGIINIISNFVYNFSDCSIINELQNLPAYKGFEKFDETAKENKFEYLSVIVQKITTGY